VDEKAMQQPTGNFGSMKLSQAIYEARRAALDELVANMLIDREAKLRELDRSALVEQEVISKVSTVTDAEIAAWYQANQSREQGRFWPYHDKLFANPSKLADADLKRDAAELGLDATKFNACVDSHKYRSDVDADIKAGEEAGVSGTPAFFVNGRMISGAQPFD